jgi:RNA polymerase sigma factor (sigma-70 family)
LRRVSPQIEAQSKNAFTHFSSRSATIDPLNAIIREHEKLVLYFLSGYSWRPDYEDILQCGRVGLWKATLDFDPAKARWSTWVSYKIRGEVTRYLIHETRLKRVNDSASLDAPIDEDGSILADLYPDERQDVENRTLDRVEADRLLAYVHDPRDREAIRARADGLSLLETSEALGSGLSRERVRQIVLRGLRQAAAGDRGARNRYQAMSGLSSDAPESPAKLNTGAFRKPRSTKPPRHRPQRG